MDIAEYQREAHDLDDNKRVSVSLLGLVGEAGGIQAALKKRLISKIPLQMPKDDLAEEIGDYLWYLASVSSLRGISLRQIGFAISATPPEATGKLSFNELQVYLAKQETPGRIDAVQALARVAVEIQQLLTIQTQTRMRDPATPLPALTGLTDLITEAFVLGLACLLDFICQQSGRTPGKLICNAAHAFNGGRKSDLIALSAI